MHKQDSGHSQGKDVSNMIKSLSDAFGWHRKNIISKNVSQNNGNSSETTNKLYDYIFKANISL